jgi:hypothetical protein
MEESPSHQIARIVAWIKQNFTKAIGAEELAANANMSPSTFRQRFRAINGWQSFPSLWCGRSFCSKIAFHLCLLSCE